MNINELKIFKEVVEAKSISKVAKSSYISQSALSQMIQKLESEIGMQLLNRSNRGVFPTEAGKIVYKYSGTMMRIHDRMKDEIHFSSMKLSNVRINGYSSFINYSLPCLLYKVKKKFPDFKFELHSKTSEETFGDLLNEVIDMGFTSEEPCDDRISFEYIGQEKIVLVASANDDIQEKISVTELLAHDMVLLDNSSTINKYFDKKLHEIGLSIEDMNIVFEADCIGAAKAAIRNNYALSFLPYMSIKKELYEGEFRAIDIEDFSIDYNIYLAYRNDLRTLDMLKPIIEYFVKSGSSEFC